MNTVLAQAFHMGHISQTLFSSLLTEIVSDSIKVHVFNIFTYKAILPNFVGSNQHCYWLLISSSDKYARQILYIGQVIIIPVSSC